MAKIGIADTTFSRVDMAKFAVDVIRKNSDHRIIRYTVPGIKDLPVACKKLFLEDKCAIVLAMGIFVHSTESNDEGELYQIAKNRTEKHALNALELLKGKTELSKYAGTGRRQGKDDEGSLKRAEK